MKNFMMLNSYFNPLKKKFYSIINVWFKRSGFNACFVCCIRISLAKMLTSKKEGYSPLDCSKAQSKYCCLGEGDRFSQFCSWNKKDKKCTWAKPRKDLLTCQTMKGQTGETCDPDDLYKHCCFGEDCDASTKKCTVDPAILSKATLAPVPKQCLE